MTTLFLIMMSGPTIASVDAIEALYPEACFAPDNPVLNERYAAGWEKGEQRAERIWASHEVRGKCVNYKRFAKRIQERMVAALVEASANGISDRRFPKFICRWYGIVDSMLENIGSKLATQCDEAIPPEEEDAVTDLPESIDADAASKARPRLRSCKRRGRYWGDFGARMYCDLSIALDGLGLLGICLPPKRPYPAGTCGERWTKGCRRSYRLSARAEPLARFDPYDGCHQVDTEPESVFFPHVINFTGKNPEVPDPDNPNRSVNFRPVFRESLFDHCRYDENQ